MSADAASNVAARRIIDSVRAEQRVRDAAPKLLAACKMALGEWNHATARSIKAAIKAAEGER